MIYAKKSLGQYFLKCGWVIDTLIQSAALAPNDTVLEIGPGRGALTIPFAKKVGALIAVEKDELLAQGLENILKKEGIRNTIIITGDILKKYSSLLANELNGKNFKIVANIPYYLTARLLRTILESNPKPSLVALTIQKEVAERIIAMPPRANLLGLSVQAYGDPFLIKEVSPECFLPKPDVTSAIIVIKNISNSFFSRHNIKEAEFFAVLRRAFSAKRKQLLGTVTKTFLRGNRETANFIFEKLRLNPEARPENLTLEQWALIVKNIRTEQQ